MSTALEVRGDPELRAFRRTAMQAVDTYRARGLCFGFPSGQAQTYTDPDDVPLPLHMMGNDVASYKDDIGVWLGVQFEQDTYGDRCFTAVKTLHTDRGVTYTFGVKLYERTFPSAGSRDGM